MNVISKRLKQARKSAGLSQERLGIEAGIEPASASARMNQYETGKHTPNHTTVVQIASVLKVSPAYFYCLDDDEARLLLGFGQLNGEMRKALLEQLAALVAKG